jgi:thiosulfate/3-mercaptopyruvate sulfurtransferase
MNRKSLAFHIFTFAIAFTLSLPVFCQTPPDAAEKDLQPGSPVIMQPQELVQALKTARRTKPLVFYIGPEMFYQQGHVPGAEFLGAAASPEGLRKLHARAASLPHGTSIVIYCGCCPWSHCPNIHPAYNELKKMGFTHLRVLFLETSFGIDWAEKGYPVQKGS